MLNNKKNIYIHIMFWFDETVHLNSVGPESKIGLSYANVVCAYGGRGGGWGLEVLKCFVREGQNFFYLLCVCVCGGGESGSVPLLP